MPNGEKIEKLPGMPTLEEIEATPIPEKLPGMPTLEEIEATPKKKVLPSPALVGELPSKEFETITKEVYPLEPVEEEVIAEEPTRIAEPAPPITEVPGFIPEVPTALPAGAPEIPVVDPRLLREEEMVSKGFLPTIPPGGLQIKPRLTSAKNAFIQGVSAMLTSIPKTVGILAAKLGEVTDMGETDPQKMVTYQIGQYADNLVKELFPIDPEFQEEFITTTLPSATGSLIGFIGGGAIGAELKGLGAAGRYVIPSMLGSSQLGASEYENAFERVTDANNLTPEDYISKYAQKDKSKIPGLMDEYNINKSKDPNDVAFDAFLLNAAIGVSEGLPIGLFFRRLDKVTGGSVKTTLGKYASNKIITGYSKNPFVAGTRVGFQEGLQEVFQNATTNYTASQVYDMTRDIFDGNTFKEGSAGFILGTTLGALGFSIKRRMVQKGVTKQDELIYQEILDYLAKKQDQLPKDLREHHIFEKEDSKDVIKLKKQKLKIDKDIVDEKGSDESRQGLIEKSGELSKEIDNLKQQELDAEKGAELKEGILESLNTKKEKFESDLKDPTLDEESKKVIRGKLEKIDEDIEIAEESQEIFEREVKEKIAEIEEEKVVPEKIPPVVEKPVVVEELPEKEAPPKEEAPIKEEIEKEVPPEVVLPEKIPEEVPPPAPPVVPPEVTEVPAKPLEIAFPTEAKIEEATKQTEIELKPNTRGATIKISDINTDVDLFQNRDEEYSQETFDNIIKSVEEGRFNELELDDVRLWRNPKDNRFYILAGHSRVEAYQLLSKEGRAEFNEIPMIEMVGYTKEQAIEFATERSNKLGTQEAYTASAKIYRKMREEGISETKITEKAKNLERDNAVFVINLSHLNPTGKAISAVNAFAKSNDIEGKQKIQTIADYAGEARKQFKDLSNLHENEIYDFLIDAYSKEKIEGKISSKGAFIKLAEIAIYKAKKTGTFAADRLVNFKQYTGKNPYKIEHDSQLAEAKKKEADVREEYAKQQSDLKKKKTTPTEKARILAPLRNELVKAIEAVNELKKEGVEQVEEITKLQTSIFDELEEVKQKKEVQDDVISEAIRPEPTIEELKQGESTVTSIEGKEKTAGKAEETEAGISKTEADIAEVDDAIRKPITVKLEAPELTTLLEQAERGADIRSEFREALGRHLKIIEPAKQEATKKLWEGRLGKAIEKGEVKIAEVEKEIPKEIPKEIDERIEKEKDNLSDALDDLFTIGITGDARSQKEKSFRLYQSTTKLAGLYIEKGILTAADFAKGIGYKLNDFLQKAWNDAMAIREGKKPSITSEKDITPELIKQAFEVIPEKVKPKVVPKKEIDEKIAPDNLSEYQGERIEADKPKEFEEPRIETFEEKEKPDTEIEEKPKVPSAYEKLEDDWFGNKDWEATKADIEAQKFQKRIQETIGKKPVVAKTFPGRWAKKWQDVDKAIHIYLDIKRNPEHLKEFYDKLTPGQKKIVNLSQNLTPEQKKIAEEISKEYEKVGLDALDKGIIQNVLDNYVARTWDLKGKPVSEFYRKFGVTTRHARQRTLETILEGWTLGYELRTEGATNNLSILKSEINATIENKKLIQEGMKIKDADGNKIFSFSQLEGYKEIEHPSFTSWGFEGKIEDIGSEQEMEVLGKRKDILITPDGTILRKQRIYAPEKIAKDLNKVLGVSKLKIPFINVDAITKFNAIIKAWILQSSFFHHLAFTRSYLFGGALESFSDLNPVGAYRKGLKALDEMTPEIELLVRNGLTIGRIQDWNETLIREKTFIGRQLDKMKVTKVIKDKIVNMQQAQANFLFNKYGAGLKAYTALLEYKRLLKHKPQLEPNERAKLAATLVNDDFGGLHLERMKRDKTGQHVFRLLALAPDWTESNVRSMVKAFKRGEEGKLYRRFWGRIAIRGMGLTTALNLLLAMWDDEDEEGNEIGYFEAVKRRYKRAWDKGGLRWLEVDITPIYRGLGGDEKNTSYFSIIGHFKDPVKFIVHPVTSAHHKGSVVYRLFHEALVGTDWRGRGFTNWDELIGIDEKGVYKTTRKGYKKGDPKGGKLKYQLTKFQLGGGSPLEYGQLPSYTLHELRGLQPIQIQNLIYWLNGEMDGIQAIGKSLGFHMAVTKAPPTEKVPKKKEGDEEITEEEVIEEEVVEEEIE